MLTCVYHPIDEMRVVESDEADRLKASGVWFDCPSKAKSYRATVEDEIKNESKDPIPKTKLKGKTHERQQNGSVEQSVCKSRTKQDENSYG